MNIREDPEADAFEVNLTPLIDVVFLLLIFFMVTTTFLDPERELQVDLPTAQSGGEPEHTPDEIVLNVLQDGRVVYEGHEIDRPHLIEMLKSAAQHDPETPVTIRGNRHAEHQKVVAVMDACGIAGLSNLAVGTTWEEQG